MISSYYLLLPFIAQAICIGVDELFHHRRGLPRWERIGHPLDTLTVLACYAVVLLAPPGGIASWMYALLACFSSLFVTKDEPVHLRYCGPVEQWLHAVLFSLHPVVLISLALLWPGRDGGTFPFIRYEGFERSFLIAGSVMTAGFAAYQLLYWNILWKREGE